MAQTIFLQGVDFKAHLWAEHLPSAPVPMVSLRDHLEVLGRSRRGDLLIYRYQNNDRRLAVALIDAALLLSNLLKAKLLGASVVWICHNVDQETSPHFKWLERLRCGALARVAVLVLVLDPAFLPHAPGKHVRAISFGEKRGGETLPETRAAIEGFASSRDLTILIAGQDGLKYRSFARIPFLHRLLSERFGRVGFVVAGMAPDRRFATEVEADVLRVTARNIDESELTGTIDFIYRENDDISMPYTLYSAATARIPVLTRQGSILEEILVREGLGLSADALVPGTYRPVTKCRIFLERHRWDSLARTLRDEGLIR